MRTRDPVRDGLFVLAAIAVAAAAWFGWTWWSSAHDDASLRGQDRDAVLAAASDGLVALNTIDYRTAQHDVDRWVQVTTGQLGKDLSGDRELQQQRATASKAIATATLKQAAVTELDHDAGTARLIAVLDLRVSTNGAPPAVNRSRLNVDFSRTGQGWKVSAVQSAAAS
jgi:Mce-associated membrane protein